MKRNFFSSCCFYHVDKFLSDFFFIFADCTNNSDDQTEKNDQKAKRTSIWLNEEEENRSIMQKRQTKPNEELKSDDTQRIDLQIRSKIVFN